MLDFSVTNISRKATNLIVYVSIQKSAMIKKYLAYAVLFSLLVPALNSCTKTRNEPPCISFKKGPVTKIDGATSASVNQEILLTVDFTCFNGCGQFNNFEEAVNGNETKIIVNAKYEGCICTQDLPTRQVKYKFRKSQPGTFTLMFLQSDNVYMSHTVIVQ